MLKRKRETITPFFFFFLWFLTGRTISVAMRATFLIDKDGVIVDTFASPDIPTPRERSRYEEALAKL